MEAVLIHLGQLASSLAGEAISIALEGQEPLLARFSLLICTPDPSLPRWMKQEWEHLESRQEETTKLASNFFGSPESLRELRQQKRTIEALGPSTSFSKGIIDAALERSKNRRPYHPLRRVGRGQQVPSPGVRHGSYLAEGWGNIRTVLSGRGKPTGYWAGMDPAIAGHAKLLGWLGIKDWAALAKAAGPKDVGRLGFMMAVPTSNFESAWQGARHTLSELMLKRFDWEPCHSLDFIYQPPPTLREVLDRQMQEFVNMSQSFPEADRVMVLPDPLIGWRLAALFAAICVDNSGPGHDASTNRRVSENQGAGLGISLASWLVAVHFHRFRQTFPSDENGSFSGVSLRVFRALTSRPETVRTIQRRLRGTDSDTCLHHLREAVRLGLAVEPKPGRFATSCPAPSGFSLSEFLSGFDQELLFPPTVVLKSTASTDTYR